SSRLIEIAVARIVGGLGIADLPVVLAAASLVRGRSPRVAHRRRILRLAVILRRRVVGGAGRAVVLRRRVVGSGRLAVVLRGRGGLVVGLARIVPYDLGDAAAALD